MAATAINRALECMGYGSGRGRGGISGHDFRARASTRLHEMVMRSEWIEPQLAHVEHNRVRADYNQAEHLAERKCMMQAWADWLDTLGALPRDRPE